MPHISTGRRRGHALVALCALVYFASYITRKDFAIVMAGMLEAGAIDKETGGWIGTALFICYGAGQLLSGVLGDHISPRRMISLGLVTSTCCNLLMPCVSGGWMIAVWALNGLAQAMLWPPIVRLLSENLTHEAFVRANLAVTVAAHAATLLLYLYVPLCLQYATWQTVFFSTAGLALLIFVLFLVTVGRCLQESEGGAPAASATAPAAPAAQGQEGYFRTLCRVGLVPILLAIVAMGFLRDGIESWVPTLYAEAFEREASESVLLSAIMPLLAILSVSLITALHRFPLFRNEVRGSAFLFICAALMCLPAYFLLSSTSTAGRLACLLCVALVSGLMHALNFLLISCLPGRFARMGRAASASGFCNACVYIGASIASYGIAFLAERFGWGVTVLAFSVVALAGLAFCLVALPAYTRFCREDEAQEQQAQA